MGKQESNVTTLAVRTSSDLAALNELDEILRTFKAPAGVVESDPDAIQREIIAELLDAETDDELEFVGSAEGWATMEGIPVVIQGFRWRPSEYDKGAPVFAVVYATRVDDGTKVVLTTGAGGVLAQLHNLARRGRLPGAIRMLVRAAKPTKGGFYPLRLATPPGVSNDPPAAEEPAA